MKKTVSGVCDICKRPGKTGNRKWGLDPCGSCRVNADKLRRHQTFYAIEFAPLAHWLSFADKLTGDKEEQMKTILHGVEQTVVIKCNRRCNCRCIIVGVITCNSRRNNEF